MGCFLSTEKRTRNNEPAYEQQGAPNFLGGIGIERDQGFSRDKSNVPVQRLSTRSQSVIVGQIPYADPNASLKKYDDLTWRGYILRSLSDVRDILKEYDLNIESLVQTEVTLVVDDCHRYSDKQISAILITVGVLISLFNAINARLLISFMTHQNPERGEYTEDEQAAAKFLDEVYFLESSSEVVKALRAGEVPVLIKENKLKGAGMRTLGEEVGKVMEDKTISPSQRHPKILALIRDTRYDYSDPYDASQLDFKKWTSLYEQARATDARQKKVLNSYSFNAIRLVQRHRAAWAERREDTTGPHGRTKTIIPTAALIDASDFDHIEAELKKVEGGGDENSIQTAHFIENSRSGTAKRQQDLDDKMAGKKDIYDYLPIDINEYLLKFFSPLGLVKLLFSEDERIDAIKSKPSRPFYGTTELIREGGVILIPTKEEVRMTFYGQAESDQNKPKKGGQGNW